MKYSIKSSCLVVLCILFSLLIFNSCGGGSSGGGETGGSIIYYEDADGDGFGNPNISITGTPKPDGYVTDNTDCNDNDSSINPLANEIDDGIDNNCNGQIDETCSIRVPEDYNTIQRAILAASNGCVITVNDGIYIENIDYLGKSIILRSARGAEKTTINGNVDGSVVVFSSGEGEDSVVDGFTITNGSTTSYGGGINCENSSPTVINCNINGNYSYYGGGGISCKDSASPTITNCNINGNISSLGGGGILILLSSPTITDCYINENLASTDGGGIFCKDSQLSSITNCTILKNTAVYGGGIAFENSSSNVIIVNSKINDNFSSYGGGISCKDSASPIITNCNIYNNKSNADGGGIYTFSSSPTIANCTITNNQTLDIGGGIYCIYSSSPKILNSIFWGNYNNKGNSEIYNYIDPSPSPSIPNSYIFITYSDIRGWWFGKGNIDADPLFIDSLNDDYHLSAGSPCIDAGTDTYIDDGENIVPSDDIDGDTRPQGTGVDIGYDEYK